MKNAQNKNNKKNISGEKNPKTKDIFIKQPLQKKNRNKSVNKYKMKAKINQNIKVNPSFANNINNNIIDYKEIKVDFPGQDINQNNFPQRRRTKTMQQKCQNNIHPDINSNKNKNANQIINYNVHRHNFGHEIYDTSFENFGSLYDERFINNYSSNFRSNLEQDVYNFLMNIIQGNRFESVEKKHPPTKNSVLNDLKKFDLTELYCKKNDNGYEYPNCCICMYDIILKQRAVLLPCGHILHWKCGEIWLKKNNTCPLCRFELPGEKTK